MKRIIPALIFIALVLVFLCAVFALPVYIDGVNARIGLSAYCHDVHKLTGCEIWTDSTLRVNKAGVMYCYYLNRYPENELDYYECLEEKGI